MMRQLKFLIATVFCVVVFAPGVQAQGAATFTSLEHDFGSFPEGEKPTYTFTFSNTGDEPVRIMHVQPSCGCTAPSYSTEPIGPGEEGEIVVEYNSQGRPGEFNKTIAVQFVDQVDSATLRIRGTVIPTHIHNGVVQGSIVFDADNHEFENLNPNAVASHVFRMQNNADAPLRILESRTFAEGVSVTYPDRPIFPEEIVDIQVVIADVENKLNAHGRMDIAVVLQTDDAMQPIKSLRLIGRAEQAEATESVASQ